MSIKCRASIIEPPRSKLPIERLLKLFLVFWFYIIFIVVALFITDIVDDFKNIVFLAIMLRLFLSVYSCGLSGVTSYGHRTTILSFLSLLSHLKVFFLLFFFFFSFLWGFWLLRFKGIGFGLSGYIGFWLFIFIGLFHF